MDDLRSAPIPALRAGDHVRGAGQIVLFYGDFACPRCALAHAAEAAALQGAFWAFHDSLYADPGRLDDPHLWERAETLGLDVARFDADRRSDTVAARVTRDVREAMRAGIITTPTLVVDGVLHPGPDGVSALG